HISDLQVCPARHYEEVQGPCWRTRRLGWEASPPLTGESVGDSPTQSPLIIEVPTLDCTQLVQLVKV
ncbi:MAG: hypothetical protein ACREA0_15505, partial [bacterium]